MSEEQKKLLETQLWNIANELRGKMITNTGDLEAIRDESLIKLGYFLKPDELFSAIAKRGNANTETESNFILEDLESILNSIE